MKISPYRESELKMKPELSFLERRYMAGGPINKSIIYSWLMVRSLLLLLAALTFFGLALVPIISEYILFLKLSYLAHNFHIPYTNIIFDNLDRNLMLFYAAMFFLITRIFFNIDYFDYFFDRIIRSINNSFETKIKSKL